MKLTVLGKYGGYPKAGGATSSYLLQCGGTRLLLDLGSGCFSRLLKHCGMDDVDIVILTHLHFDHCADMFIWGYAKYGKNELFLPATPEWESKTISGAPRFDSALLTEDTRISRDSVEITFCKTEHPVENYAVKVQYGGKTLVYTGDGVYTKNLEAFAKGADVLLIDSGFMGPPDPEAARPHMLVTEAAKIAKQGGVGLLLLTHINPDYNELELLAEAKSVFETSIVVQEETTYEL